VAGIAVAAGQSRRPRRFALTISGRRRPLVLTGGPAVGKTTTGRALAERRPRAAFVDADDVRQFVVAGAEPLWRGDEGIAQHLLGAQNTSLLAGAFVRAGFEVVVADVVTAPTAPVYRSLLPDCLIVHLVVPFAEARRRASTRPDTDDPPDVDHRLEVAALSFQEQVDAVDDLWRA
jgi:predicted kinase